MKRKPEKAGRKKAARTRQYANWKNLIREFSEEAFRKNLRTDEEIKQLVKKKFPNLKTVNQKVIDKIKQESGKKINEFISVKSVKPSDEKIAKMLEEKGLKYSTHFDEKQAALIETCYGFLAKGEMPSYRRIVHKMKKDYGFKVNTKWVKKTVREKDLPFIIVENLYSDYLTRREPSIDRVLKLQKEFYKTGEGVNLIKKRDRGVEVEPRLKYAILKLKSEGHSLKEIKKMLKLTDKRVRELIDL